MPGPTGGAFDLEPVLLRHRAPMVWTGQALYLFPYDEVHRYVPGSGTVDRLDINLSNPRDHAPAFWSGDTAFIVGGSRFQSSPNIDVVWDTPVEGITSIRPSDGRVHELNVTLPAHAARAATWTLVWASDSLYWIGASTEDANGTAILSWQPGDHRFHDTGHRLPKSVARASAAWTGQEIVVVGGRTGPADAYGNRAAGGILHYDPASGNVTTVETNLTPDGYPLVSPRLVVDDGDVVVFPQRSGTPSGQTILRYDPGDREISTLRDGLPGAREPRFGFSHEGAIYLVIDHHRYPAHSGELVIWRPGAGGGPGGSQRPIAAFDSDVSGGTVITDACASYDADGLIVTYEWDWGDGERSSGPGPTHTYDHAGDYTITLTVVDDDGDVDRTNRTVVLEDGPPIIGSLGDPWVDGLRVDANAAQTRDAFGEIETIRWDWGDGQTSWGTPVNHTYDEPGVYTVELTVTDDDGQVSTKQWTVEVGRP